MKPRLNGLLEKLQSNLDEDDILVKVAAKVRRISLNQLLPFLRRTLKEEKTETRRIGAILALGALGGEALPALPEMMSALEDENAKVREYAAKNIGSVLIFSQTEGAHPEVIELLRRRLFDVEVKVQKEAIRSLGWMGAVAGIAAPDIVQKLRDCDKDLVREAIDCLGRIGPSAADAADAILGHHVHTR